MSVALIEGARVYVINLDQSKDRLEAMEAGFGAVGVSFQRVPGVYGPHAVLPPLVRASEHLSAGEIGCLLSHRRCYEEILAASEPWGIIFEDDVLIQKEGWSALQRAFALKPSNCELLKFQGQVLNPKKIPLKYDLCAINSEHWIQFRVQNPQCAAGYAIHKSACKKILAQLELLEPADLILEHAWKYSVRAYNVEPQLFGWSKFHESSVIQILGRVERGVGIAWKRRDRVWMAWLKKVLYSLRVIGVWGSVRLFARYAKAGLERVVIS